MFRFPTLSTLAATAALICPLMVSTQVSAQSAPGTAASSPINVQGQRDNAPRGDLSRVCPAAHTELPESLATAYQTVGVSGVVRMRVAFEGQKVVHMQALDGPRRYHRYLRSAMYDMNCSSDREGRQVFEFAVRFADPSELRGQRVALLQVDNRSRPPALTARLLASVTSPRAPTSARAPSAPLCGWKRLASRLAMVSPRPSTRRSWRSHSANLQPTAPR